MTVAGVAAQPLSTITLPESKLPAPPEKRLPAHCTMPQVDRAWLSEQFGRLLTHRHGQKSGALIAELTFHSPVEPPSVRMVFDGGDKRLGELVQQAVRDYRLDCAEEGKPFKAVQEFNFVALDDEKLRLKRRLQLVDLVRLTPPAKLARVKIDTQAMRCPFELKFAPYQPYLQNRVVEVGTSDPARAPLLKWLASLELDIPLATMRTAIGQVSIVEVPCAVIDLT